MNKFVIRYDIGSSEYYPELIIDLIDGDVREILKRQFEDGFVMFPDGGIIPTKEIRRMSVREVSK